MNYSFLPISFHEDDRAQRYLDIFPSLDTGQINISYVNSNQHIVAWHKHNIQTDYWVCVKGSFKVGLATEKNGATFEYLSDKNPRILKIPPDIYHGYKAIEPGSILMYYLTEKYNPKDEYRVKIGYFKEKWITENK
jgi:dTDP-4-dehydrorhamnose 3,5-epimerase-like enzyme